MHLRSKRLHLAIFITLCVLLTATFANTAQRFSTGSGTAAKQRMRRTALVIGNANYKEGRLLNPINDATDIANALRQLGFELLTLQDASLQEMEDALDQFSRNLRQGGLGLFYFAGHGIQVQGENYLIPLDARLSREQDVRYQALPVGRVLGAMEDARNRLNLVFLDACRNNPFTRGWRSSQQGLAAVAHAEGVIIAYATGPGKIAEDGKGRNGTYTQYLLQHLATPGLPIELMLKRVRAGVASATKRKQIPWSQSSLIGDVYLAPAVPQSPPKIATPDPLPIPQPKPTVYTLTVKTNPPDSTVEVMNIGSRYRPGMVLEPGQYDILVQREGYRSARQWVTIRDQNVVVDMTLDKQSDSSLLGLWVDPERSRAFQVFKEGDQLKLTTTLRDGKAVYDVTPKGHNEYIYSVENRAYSFSITQGRMYLKAPNCSPCILFKRVPRKDDSTQMVSVPSSIIDGKNWSRHLPAFRIDLKPINNREFYQFIRLHREWGKIENKNKWYDNNYLKYWESEKDLKPKKDEMDDPVRNVSYYTALAYCEHKGQVLPGLNHYRSATKHYGGELFIKHSDKKFNPPQFTFSNYEWTNMWWHSSDFSKNRVIYQHNLPYHSKQNATVREKHYTEDIGFRCITLIEP